MTKRVLAKLNDRQRNAIFNYRNEYQRADYKADRTPSIAAKNYIKGLVDAEVITETEGRCLFCYVTV